MLLDFLLMEIAGPLKEYVEYVEVQLQGYFGVIYAATPYQPRLNFTHDLTSHCHSAQP